jgi:putative tryptophan/tyrosine transport system substrate-binding protein
MTKKILVWLLVIFFVANVSVTHAQQPEKIFRIGYLDGGTAAGTANLVRAFLQELSKLGWIEGKNFTIEYRFAENKGTPGHRSELAAELVRLKVDLIVVTGNQLSLAAKKATGPIPIVMVTVGDPVGDGLVASLARPSGNVTGLSSLDELNT